MRQYEAYDTASPEVKTAWIPETVPTCTQSTTVRPLELLYLSFMLSTSISSCLFWCLCFSVYFGLQWSLTAWSWESAVSPADLTDTWEGGHSAISSCKNLSSSSPAPCSLCSGQYRQLRAIIIDARGRELIDPESSCSHVSLTHEVYSQMSKPYLNDFIWYSFLLVLGSVPLFCAVSFSFKGLGNYCNPKGKQKKQTL